jgi:uncharacterized protein (DUF2062 family)
MPKKFFQRYLPDPRKIREIESLKFLGDKLHRPNLWHINRRSVANAFACGLFAMYTPPLPWQMIIAAILAIYFNANLPIAVALVWITNPITWIPMYYFAYWVGALLMGKETFTFLTFSQLFSFETAWELGAPFLLGCGILMVAGAALGYFGVHALWRLHVLKRWEERKLRRQGIVVERKPNPVLQTLDVLVEKIQAAWTSPACIEARAQIVPLLKQGAEQAIRLSRQLAELALRGLDQAREKLAAWRSRKPGV